MKVTFERENSLIPGTLGTQRKPSDEVSGPGVVVKLPQMAYLHCRMRTQIPTRIWTPNLMATWYCTETVPIALTWTPIPIWIGIRVRVQQRK